MGGRGARRFKTQTWYKVSWMDKIEAVEVVHETKTKIDIVISLDDRRVVHRETKQTQDQMYFCWKEDAVEYLGRRLSRNVARAKKEFDESVAKLEKFKDEYAQK